MFIQRDLWINAMLVSLTAQQWDKFRRHVQAGCLCRISYPHEIIEGVLLENWPYDHYEQWDEVSELMTDSDVVERNQQEFLRFQPFQILEIWPSSLLFMSFFTDNRWCSLPVILALPDET
jgi:hypothetical protein